MTSKINDDDKSLIMNVLRAVLNDDASLAKDKIAAARALGEIRGLLGKNSEAVEDTARKGLGEMSAAEIDAEIRRLEKRN
jgi:hypothetical protein